MPTTTETQELFSMLGARFTENIRAMRDYAATLQGAANLMEDAANLMEDAWKAWDLADLEAGGMITPAERIELEAYFAALTRTSDLEGTMISPAQQLSIHDRDRKIADLKTMLEKICNRVSDAKPDSTGREMVKCRKALIEEARIVLDGVRRD